MEAEGNFYPASIRVNFASADELMQIRGIGSRLALPSVWESVTRTRMDSADWRRLDFTLRPLVPPEAAELDTEWHASLGWDLWCKIRAESTCSEKTMGRLFCCYGCYHPFVQVYCSRNDSVGHELMKEIQQKLTKKCVDVEICDNPSNLLANKPVIVLCINTFRLGADVTQALKGITESDLHAVVVLHHQYPLNDDPRPSSGELTDRLLGGIFDMRFHRASDRDSDPTCEKKKLLYKCKLNTDAVKMMVKFTKQLDMKRD